MYLAHCATQPTIAPFSPVKHGAVQAASERGAVVWLQPHTASCIPPNFFHATPQVGFHKTKNGQDWVWVYGEAPGDLPYIELVRKNDRERKLRKGEETSYVRHADIYHITGGAYKE